MTDTAGRERLREALPDVPLAFSPYVLALKTAREAFGETAVSDEDMWEFVRLLHERGYTIVEAAALAHDRPSDTEAELRAAFERGVEFAAHDRPSGSGLRERVAEAIYDAMRENDPEGASKPWVPGGNSRKQDEARHRADRALSGSSDPEAVGLDVERLRNALVAADEEMGNRYSETFPLDLTQTGWPRFAAAIAAEYARLTEAKPETPA